MPVTDVRGSTFIRAAGGFADEHDDLKRDVRRILDSIAALGDFAGTDETANTFKQGYSAALQKAETYVNALRDIYPGVAGRLDSMTTGFDVANWATIASLPKVSEPPKYSKSDKKFTS
ncbi:hypothetical protein Misp01_62000 [Microtetraspora sp. NBRC 13810]|uniref:hypothetical protein n=1 Tax=Microtetraspora sp. NBRC 13810 TaxID=3030990 RepID=UPI0024A5245A|nr:hypothetical protein [Microtetraspora sp. NBRC 13810]GLW11072.1 hypothetical protein Misp01_62000 [Microtetraspora sp. NBRC 13810]